MDMSSLAAFFDRHALTIIVYALIIGTIVAFRKRIEWQTFGIGMYRTKVGLKLMDRLGTRQRGWVRVFGYVSIAIAFIGMVYIVGMLFYGLWSLIFRPEAPPILQPVLPGVSFPGSEITIPLIYGWLALFLLLVIHEFCHGVVSRAHDVPIKSSGLLIFGPLGGAFVEPDEKKLEKTHEAVQYSMIAAGPASNIITAIIAIFVSGFLLAPALNALTTPAGIEVVSVPEGYPAYEADIREGMVITSINGEPVSTVAELSSRMDNVTANQTVMLGIAGAQYDVVTTDHPTDAESAKGYIGINMKNKRDALYAGTTWVIVVLNVLIEFMKWFFILSVGIGLANLLPIGPVDGGRIMQLATRSIAKDKKRGDWWWKKISMVVLAIIIILLIAFFLKPLFA